jgi:hypothetical protein
MHDSYIIIKFQSVHMKNTISLFLSVMLPILLAAQDPIIFNRYVNRNLHQQDGHFIINTYDAPSFPYAVQGESIVTSDFNPFLVIQEDTTGTTIWSALEGVSLFPNPARDKIILNRDTPEDDLTIELISPEGIPLRKVKWPNGVHGYQLHIRDLPQGNYFLVVAAEQTNRRSTYKVLKL